MIATEAKLSPDLMNLTCCVDKQQSQDTTKSPFKAKIFDESVITGQSSILLRIRCVDIPAPIILMLIV